MGGVATTHLNVELRGGSTHWDHARLDLNDDRSPDIAAPRNAGTVAVVGLDVVAEGRGDLAGGARRRPHEDLMGAAA